MAYYKPQSPIQSGEDFIYPLTTADQVMVDENTRLNAVGVYLENIDNSTDTTVYGNNATTLGGVAAEDYALKTDTAPDSSKLGGKGPEYYIQPRNLLDNSDFRNPVNQRGNVTYTGTVYTIDRWFFPSDSTLTISNGYITLSTGFFVQRIEYSRLTSNMYTIGFATTNGLYMGTVSTDIEVGKDSYAYTDTHHRVAFYRESNSIAQVYFLTDVTENIIYAFMYEGTFTQDTLPPYVPKGYAQELAECRGYYRKNIQSVLYCYANSYLFPFVMETPMHRVPTYNITAAYTSTWGEISGDITMSPATVYGVNTFTNSNFKAGQYYRLFIEVNADL